MSNAAILKHFPGASNAGLRARIREALHRAPTVADAMNGIRYTVALSPSGAAKLSALESELRHNRAGGKRTAKRSSNRAGTKRRATKKTANKAGKRRNRAGTPKRSARTGRFVSR
jgi:hypothetical protein